jgi:beta propeller repeat protein
MKKALLALIGIVFLITSTAPCINAKGKEVPMCTNKEIQCESSNYGDKVVWIDFRNGIANVDIYMYDLKEKKETPICSTGRDQIHPRIRENKIVWDDDRNSIGDFVIGVFTCTF